MDKDNRTLTISQLSALLNVSKPTLRFWEKEFKGILVPLRTGGGQRRYTVEHVDIVKEIRTLKKTGLRLDEIRSNLKERNSGDDGDPEEIDYLAERVAEMVKKEIVKYLQKQGA